MITIVIPADDRNARMQGCNTPVWLMHRRRACEGVQSIKLESLVGAQNGTARARYADQWVVQVRAHTKTAPRGQDTPGQWQKLTILLPTWLTGWTIKYNTRPKN